MIDQYGFIVDQTGDQGDACAFTCAGIILGLYADKATVHYNAVEGFWNDGNPVRHPHGGPNHSNPKNFTRDQAVELMWVLDPIRIAIFLTKNPHFFPNVERDYPGTVKHPYPHKFINDKGKPEFRWFDYADIMTPDFIGMCRHLMGDDDNWIMPVARFWCRRSIDSHCNDARADKTNTDFKQLYFTAKALGLHLDFAAQHPWGLYFAAEQYFTKRRNLPELEQAFIREFKREGIKE